LPASEITIVGAGAAGAVGFAFVGAEPPPPPQAVRASMEEMATRARAEDFRVRFMRGLMWWLNMVNES
jgi:hypothetical protein